MCTRRAKQVLTSCFTTRDSGCGALKRPFIFSPAPEGPLGFDAPRRISACVDYARLAIEHPPYPKQMSKHFIDVIPAGVLRLEAMRPLSQAIKDLPTEVLCPYLALYLLFG